MHAADNSGQISQLGHLSEGWTCSLFDALEPMVVVKEFAGHF